MGVIGYDDVGNLIILHENVYGENYIGTLSGNLLDSVENLFGDKNHPLVFQHDNDPAHTSRRILALLD